MTSPLDKPNKPPRIEVLESVNYDINKRIMYKTDEGKDYWQSPRETWDRMTGDCEDIAIAKYFALQQFIPDSDMHLGFVRTHGNVGHLVLLVRVAMLRRSKWWKLWEPKKWVGGIAVLDNVTMNIYDLDSETHYEIEYMINSTHFIKDQKVMQSYLHPKWKDMIDRCHGADSTSGGASLLA